MPPNRPLSDHSFFIAKDNLSKKDVEGLMDTIMNAGGILAFELELATHVVVQLPGGASPGWWQCENHHRAVRAIHPASMSVPQLLYAIMQKPQTARPKIITHTYLDMWLRSGKETTGMALSPHRISLCGPKSTRAKEKSPVKSEPTVANKTEPKWPTGNSTDPRFVKTEPMSLPASVKFAPVAPVAPKSIIWPLPASTAKGPTTHSPKTPSMVFGNIGVCTFYSLQGCSPALDWVIKGMGGSMDAANRALYILVPHSQDNDIVLDKAQLHPSAAVLDEQFVFDCLKLGAFPNLETYKVHATLATPGHSVPRNNDRGGNPSPNRYSGTVDNSRAHTTPSPTFDRYFPTFKSPASEAAAAGSGKRQRDDDGEAEAGLDESRQGVRVSVDKRWKDNIARAVKGDYAEH